MNQSKLVSATFFLLINTQLCALADWTILLYMQTRNNLNSYTHDCLRSLASVGSHETVNLLVEWYQPYQPKAARYKVEKNNIVLEEQLSDQTHGCLAQDLYESMKWAVTKYPAKKYCLILRDHGLGILDPLPEHWHRPLDKGILHNAIQNVYMDYENLSSALTQINAYVLGNNKIDILAMDACLMGMIEIAYQVRKHAQYFIASQEAAWITAWKYSVILQPLLTKMLTSCQLAQHIVATYAQTNAKTPRNNTLSAIDTRAIDDVKKSIDHVIYCIQQCQIYDKNGINNLIMQARKKSLQFHEACYIDLYSFYDALIAAIHEKQKDSPNYGHLIDPLKQAIEESKKCIQTAVIAHTSHGDSKRARGLSIYFPCQDIHFSYQKNEFAQESLWLQLLQSLR